MSDIVLWQAGIVKGFSLKMYNEKLYDNILGYYSGKEVEICIRERKKKTSANTHGYYRGVILPLCLSSEMFGGWKIDEIHDYFASKFLAEIKEKLIGDKTVIIKTTLSTGEIGQKRMNEFIDHVRQELQENQIETPNPERK